MADEDASERVEYDDLLALYLDRLNEGEFLDPEEVRAKYPDWG